MKLITRNRFGKVKIVALLVYTFSIAYVFAAPNHSQGSSLRLLLPPGGEHAVFINNVPYTGIYDRFKVDNLRPGNHRIKIVELVVSRRGRVVDRIVLYNGMVYVPKNARVWAQVSNNGRFTIERVQRQNVNRGNNGRDRYDNREYENYRDNDYDRDNHDRNRDDDDWYGYNEQNSNNSDDAESEDEQRYSGDQQRRSNESAALTLNAIKRQSFDTERLKIAKNAVTRGNMISSEIGEITKLFSFESTRLEFAKYAYTYTIDKENYVIVEEAFQFRSSASELQDYITQMGN